MRALREWLSPSFLIGLRRFHAKKKTEWREPPDNSFVQADNDHKRQGSKEEVFQENRDGPRDEKKSDDDDDGLM